MRPESSHLDRTSLVNKVFIIWLRRKRFYGANAENPARARWAYLTVKESNQNAGFPSSCALVSVVNIDRCNWVSLVCLG